MVRRTKAEALVTRGQILDAAELCFRTLGVSGTSMGRIAQQAGCTRGAIYWHFKKTAEVLRAVVARGQLHLLDELEPIACQPSGLLTALRAVLERNLRCIQSDPHVRSTLEIMVYRCDYAGDWQELLERHLLEMDRLEQQLRRILERADALGELRPRICCATAAALIASTFVGALRRYLMRPHTQRHGAEPAAVIAMALDDIAMPQPLPGSRP
ncbi:TetR family transcriptional regulator [Stenotrophomonas maltophilia]|uniref:TetR family transcriptional regulator n=1 Tax=Stenotrophomonas maltophilia TaxID=40324 RepID=UPI0013DBB2E8|nr:TetR family transcriptional regulator [Stenotrophomonas maltophilia]